MKVCVEELGLDPNIANDQGDTALHVAHSADIVRYLVARGARLDAKNKQGKTPLDVALARIDRSNRQLRPDAVAALKELSGGPAASAGETTSGAGTKPGSRTP